MSPDALAIRDGALALLTTGQALPGVDGGPLFKSVLTNRTDLEPDDELPALVILRPREQMTPDGDANVGPPRFIADLTLVFLVKVFADAYADLEPLLEERTRFIVSTLLTDPDFVNLSEACTGVVEGQGFPRDGETFYGEARVEMTFQYRLAYEPLVPNDFLRLRETVRLPGANTPTLTTDIDVRTGQPWPTA